MTVAWATLISKSRRVVPPILHLTTARHSELEILFLLVLVLTWPKARKALCANSFNILIFACQTDIYCQSKLHFQFCVFDSKFQVSGKRSDAPKRSSKNSYISPKRIRAIEIAEQVFRAFSSKLSRIISWNHTSDHAWNVLVMYFYWGGTISRYFPQ